MRSKAENDNRKQVLAQDRCQPCERIRQPLLPMVSGVAAAKQDLMAWVQEVGLVALEEVFESDVEALTEPSRVSRRLHFLGGWGPWDDHAGFHQRFALELRAEVFNLFNRVNLGLPSTSLFNSDGSYRSNAGRITETRTSARQMQLGVKFIF